MPSLSWVELHGAFTHMPLAFLLSVPLFEIGAIVFRKPEWHTVSFWLLVGAVVMAVPSLLTGWFTGNDIFLTRENAQAPAIFYQHRLAAFATSGLAIVLLAWRIKSRDRLPKHALTASILLAAVTAATVGYTGFLGGRLAAVTAATVGYTGFLGGRMVFGGGSEPASASNYVPVNPAAAPAAKNSGVKIPNVEPRLVIAGARLFKELPCQSCHRMEGKGGTSGPDLTHEAQRHADIQWQIEHLKNPQKMKPNSDMPPFDHLSAAELKALAAYLVTRK